MISLGSHCISGSCTNVLHPLRHSLLMRYSCAVIAQENEKGGSDVSNGVVFVGNTVALRILRPG